MSDNRSQMADPEQEQPWRKALPKWWSSTPPEFRDLRRRNPHLAMWAEMDENRDKDGSIQLPARDTTPEQDAMSRQTRYGGQKFRTDAPVEAGDDEFLRSPEKWNQRKKL